MSSDTNTSVHSRVISAFFDTEAAAKKTIDDLIAAGIPSQQITKSDGAGAGDLATGDAGADTGFWESLKDMFLPDEDRHAYAEGLRRGGILVSVRTDEANYTRVLDILDKDGAVNMDERETQWRAEGWSGYQAGGAKTAVGGTALGLEAGTLGAGTATPAPAPVSTKIDTTATAAVGTTSVTGGKDEVIPVYEEQLRVGKRDVNNGRVRLRSYVVETPVSEQVSLRDETVTVDRKPVDRPVSATDALFQDRTIEVEEHAEEAVIAKDARVKEEITVRKTVDDRVQTVNDTLRRTEVDIEDSRGAATGTAARFSAATDSSEIVEHMDVISADGQKVGTVDHLDGPDRIKLAKNTSPDGQHHFVPLTWIDHVDQHVHLAKSAAEVKAGW